MTIQAEIDAEDIDIYDADLRPLGRKNRKQAHIDGDWHRTFHCWLVHSTSPALLFQVRSKEMANFPEMLDVSAAGHLTAGEDVMDGVREVREELGIDFRDTDLVYAGERVEVADQANGQRNREYQSVFFLKVNHSLVNFRPQEEEVSGLTWLPLTQGVELFTGQRHAVDVTVRTFSHGRTSEHLRTVTVDDFLPRIQRYYLASLIMSERLLENRLPIALS